MTRRLALMLVAAVLMAAPALFAHEDFRIVGVVKSRNGNQFVVNTTEGGVASIALNQQTKVTRNKTVVALSEIKPGQTVVVDAYGDSEDDLLALEVQLVPPIPAKK
jgi:hypothetical protein